MQMLTHYAGLAYNISEPTLKRWRASQGQDVSPGTTVAWRYPCPLNYEPGTLCSYSFALD